MTGPLYALPAFAVLVSRAAGRAIPLAALVAAIVAALPFVAFGNVSFDNYLAWVGTSASNGLVFWTLRQNLEWSLFLLLPLVPGLLPAAPRSDRWLTGVDLRRHARRRDCRLEAWRGRLPPDAISARHPVMPPAPALAGIGLDAEERQVLRADFAASRWHARSSSRCRSHISLGGEPHGRPGACRRRRRDFSMHTRRSGSRSATRRKTSRSPTCRPLVVFRQRAYLARCAGGAGISAVGAGPSRRHPAGDRTLRRDTWLIARDGAPFSLRNRYPSTGHVPLFPGDMRQAFTRAYARTSSTEYFDVWTCRHPRR